MARKRMRQEGCFIRRLDCCIALLRNRPAFGHAWIDSPPYFAAHIRCGVALNGDGVMGTPQDHRKWAEECMIMASAADTQKDKALWLTLAQSFVRLAEHVERAAQLDHGANGQEPVLAGHPSD
jgi:hypothetical protein